MTFITNVTIGYKLTCEIMYLGKVLNMIDYLSCSCTVYTNEALTQEPPD